MVNGQIHGLNSTHHKLVNTTPNPRATKNRRGELLPCWFCCGSPEGVGVEAGVNNAVVDGAVKDGTDGVVEGGVDTKEVGSGEENGSDVGVLAIEDTAVVACRTTALTRASAPSAKT